MASRRQQIEIFQKKVEDLAAELFTMLEDFREAYDNIPENLVNGPSASTLDERINTMENWHDSLEEIADEAIE